MPRDLDLTKRNLWGNHGVRYRDEQGTRICVAPMLSSIHVSDLNLRRQDRAVTGNRTIRRTSPSAKLYTLGEFTRSTSQIGVRFRLQASSNWATSCPLGVSQWHISLSPVCSGLIRLPKWGPPQDALPIVLGAIIVIHSAHHSLRRRMESFCCSTDRHVHRLCRVA